MMQPERSGLQPLQLMMQPANQAPSGVQPLQQMMQPASGVQPLQQMMQPANQVSGLQPLQQMMQPANRGVQPLQHQQMMQPRSQMLGRNTAQVQRPSWMQRKGKGPKKSKKVKLSLWEHEFICLASCGQLTPPSSMEKIDLIRAGLGPKKIPFLDFGEPFEFHDEITSAFPKLRNAGGYELLRTQQHNNRELFVISPPSDGYTAEYLRRIVGQAKVFVRPIQKDLSLDPLVDKDDLVCYLVV